MASLKLIHNHNAGDEDHSKEKLISLMESQDFSCDYSTIRSKGWDKIAPETEVIMVAGGDGTVRQVVDEILKRSLLCKKIPLALLPLGTANNLSQTLGITEDAQALKSLHSRKIKKFDVAQVSGIKKTGFFIEGIGFGVFPELIKRMKKIDSKLSDKPQERLDYAICLLSEITSDFKTTHCQLIIDGVDHSGHYLLAEIMNIKSIGPNLKLAPEADPGDGLFEIVLISENERASLVDYLCGLSSGKDDFRLKPLQGKNIIIKWDGTSAHVDDQLIKLKANTAVKVEIRESLLDFLIS